MKWGWLLGAVALAGFLVARRRQLGRWTHVAGSYDSVTKTITVWVDGVAKQTVGVPTAWAANSLLRIGNRKNTSTQFVEPLYGSVADAQIFDRAVVREDFTGTTGTLTFATSRHHSLELVKQSRDGD